MTATVRLWHTRTLAVFPALALCLLAAMGCESASPAPMSIAGRRYDVTSVNARIMPTTMMLRGRTSCDAVPVTSATMDFLQGGGFVLTVNQSSGFTSTFNTGFTEPDPGVIAVVSARDTAFVLGDSIAVRLSGVGCNLERYVGIARHT